MDEHAPLTADEANLIVRIRRLRRLRELDGPVVIIGQAAMLVEKRLDELCGGDPSEDCVSQHKRDLEDAAGECMVKVPEPGTELAKVVRANALLRREQQLLRDRVVYMTSAPDPDDVELVAELNAVGVVVRKTIYEELGEERAGEIKRFLLYSE